MNFNFPDMVAQAMRDAGQASNQAPPILPEAALMTLREAAARYAESLQGPRFKVGDVVTPVACSTIKGIGDPHIVVETRVNPGPYFTPAVPPSNTENGMRLDVRVMYLNSYGGVAICWAESCEFEIWKGETP